MSELKVLNSNDPNEVLQQSTNFNEICSMLKEVNIRFEHWETPNLVNAGDEEYEIIGAYVTDIDRLMVDEGYQSVDVVSINTNHPDKQALRYKFLSEHTHTDDEVRFFVEGQGLFSMHIDNKVYEVLCTKGDLISVPANTPHWFDMGPNPHFVAIRLFNSPDGWVANYTGSAIAESFSRLEN